MRKSRPDRLLLLLLAAYLVLGAFLAHHFRARINPDGISYLAVAGHVLAGRWTAAVNGYWGPLYSWLMVPLLAVGVPAMAAGRVVGLAAGLAALLGVWRLVPTAGGGRGAALAAVAALVPAFALYATVTLTPDLLFLAVWLHYLALVHRSDFGSRRRDAAAAGLLAGLGYLAKAYGLYIFVLHCGVFGLARLVTAAPPQRRRLLGSLAVAVLVFAACALPWMAALGAKYGGGLPASTSGPYNRALFGPDSKGQPLEHLGFLPPVNDQAVSAWEDPTGLPVPDWSPLDDARSLRHQVRLIAINLRRLALATVHSNYTALLGLPLALWAVLRRRRGEPWPGETALLATMAVFPLGYLLVYVELRYVWVSVVAGVVLSALAAERWTRGRPAVVAAAALAAVVLGCWAGPGRALRGSDRLLAGVDATVARLAGPTEAGQRLAADDRWVAGIAVAYRLGLRFHGVRGDLEAADAGRILAEQGVDWYLVWNPDAADGPAQWGWTPLGPAGGGDVPLVFRAPGRP